MKALRSLLVMRRESEMLTIIKYEL